MSPYELKRRTREHRNAFVAVVFAFAAGFAFGAVVQMVYHIPEVFK